MALASMDDDVCRAARRILIIGVTGSGKSTHARAIEDRSGIPAIDVDAMAGPPRWVKTPQAYLGAETAVAATNEWCMDSAWSAVRPVALPRTELVVAPTCRASEPGAAAPPHRRRDCSPVSPSAARTSSPCGASSPGSRLSPGTSSPLRHRSARPRRGRPTRPLPPVLRLRSSRDVELCLASL